MADLNEIIAAKTAGHMRHCPALTDGETCVCGLEWRIKLQTEQTMHAAWRKRAEEAEDRARLAEAQAEGMRSALEPFAEMGDLVIDGHTAYRPKDEWLIAARQALSSLASTATNYEAMVRVVEAAKPIVKVLDQIAPDMPDETYMGAWSSSWYFITVGQVRALLPDEAEK